MKLEKYLPYGAAAFVLYLLLNKKAAAAPVPGSTTGNIIKNFADSMYGVADTINNTYGVPPIITISQAALESNYGISELTRQANNLFGIKATSAWITAGGAIYTANTKEYILGIPYTTHADFRRYSSWQQSANDWIKLLATSSRYANTFNAAKTGNMELFAKAISTSGYATDPGYYKALMTKFNAIKGYV